MIKKRIFVLTVLFIMICSGLLPHLQTAAASDNEHTIYEYLINSGFNTAAAVGILANIEAESSFNPNAYGDYVNGTATSYGICQWHNDRWTNLKNYRPNDWTTLNGQLAFLVHELEVSRKTINSYMRNSIPNTSDGAYEAGRYWCYYFEVPANRDSVSVTRGNRARNYYWPRYYTGPINVTTSYTDYPAKESIGITNAVLAKTLSVSGASVSSVSTVGIELYNGSGSRIGYKTETPVTSGSVINIWYDVNSELGCTLSPSTSYRYRFLAVIGGTYYYSPDFTFTTGPNWTEYSAKHNIGETNAVLARTLSMTDSTPISSVSTVGIELYNSSGSRIGYKTETPVSSGSVINMWYDCNSELGVTLSPGTNYTYRFLAVINGVTCYSPTYSFTSKGTSVVRVTGITLNTNSLALDVAKGTTGTLTATVTPSNATNKNITWESSDPSVATVSGGVVSPVSAGSTVITCRAADGSGVTATCTVTVKYSAHINRITASASSVETGDTVTWTVNAGSTEGALTYTYRLYRDGGLYREFGETSASSKSVSMTLPGTYYMSVMARDTAGNTTSYKNSGQTEVTHRIELDSSALKMSRTGAGSRVWLRVTNLPETSETINVTWTSSNENVVTVSSDGVIRATGTGSATVSASIGNGPAASCQVSVVSSMRTLTLPAGLAEAGYEAFTGTNAEIIILPDGMTTIGDKTFANNRNLRYIVIPDSVNKIGADALSGCPNVFILSSVDGIAHKE